MYWAARDHRYNMSIGFCLSVSVPIRASPSRLLLLFKGLAAPSPLKQKEKRDWVRLPPSDQNTSSKTIGGKKKNKTLRSRQDTATFQTLEILYRTTNPRNIITCIWCTRYSLFFVFFWYDWSNILIKVNLIELWYVATGKFGTSKMWRVYLDNYKNKTWTYLSAEPPQHPASHTKTTTFNPWTCRQKGRKLLGGNSPRHFSEGRQAEAASGRVQTRTSQPHCQHRRSNGWAQYVHKCGSMK